MGNQPVVMTIAGSDSGGGAGIQADLKTITVLGGFGVSVVTALTAQNSVGVQAAHYAPSGFVAAQLSSVTDDFKPRSAKTGMLATAQIVEVVATGLKASGINRLVVDPVMISTTGHSLIDESAVTVLVERLFPLALVITPNIHEAAALLGREIDGLRDMERASRELHALGPKAVLLKGGHLKGPASDFFFDGKRGEILESQRVESPHTHGSGCVLSAAIATFLAKGLGLPEAVRRSKEFITRAIAGACQIGRGPGPVNPLAGR